MNLRGVPRFTADLDLTVDLEDANLEKLETVLRGMGLRARLPESVRGLAVATTRADWVNNRNLKAFTFQDPDNPLRQVDLVITFPFEEVEADADAFTARGLTIHVASVKTLVRMKTGTGRDQDVSDIDALRRISELDDE